MCFASSRRGPAEDAPSTLELFLELSMPARSTSTSLPLVVEPSVAPALPRSASEKTACERDERAFMLICAVARRAVPRESADRALSTLATSSSVNPATKGVPEGNSRSGSAFFSRASKSTHVSLYTSTYEHVMVYASAAAASKRSDIARSAMPC